MTDTAAPSITDLVAQLTLDEKVLLLEGVDSWNTNGIPRLGVRRLFLTDGPHGVRKVRSDSGAFGLAEAEPSTAFPTSTTLAKTWDPALAREVGAAIGRESAALGVDVLLAPGVNIMRSPLCGRNFEYFSEDPLVAGVFGAAFVQGVQSTGVAASVKHFAANSNEDYRFVGDSVVDERALREIYLRAFERIVKDAAPATVMCAYNRLNGTFCSEDRELLTDILRDEWGFDGLVMTDWGATNDRVAGIVAGCELDMPGGVEHNRTELLSAVHDGRLPEEILDQAVARVLSLVERCTHDHEAAPVDAAAHGALATRVAVEGAVLLANDGTLPLAASAGGLVVIGEQFERMRYQGAGSSLISPPATVSPRRAFDTRSVGYRYARGYRSLDVRGDSDLHREAVEAARDAETVLFFGGLGDLEESEGFDRSSMTLPAAQVELLNALVDAGARVVLVLSTGSPVEIPRHDELSAVLLLSLPGMNGGEAAARLLFGEEGPSGRLTESWPLTAADASCQADYDRSAIAAYYESIYVGYRFYDAAGTALRYPFGHGLGYTEFVSRDLEVTIADGRVIASVTVANTGERAGAEVVQVYVRNNRGRVFKAEKELRVFEKVRLAAGASRRVTLEFPVHDLAFWSVEEHDWVLEDGEYEVLVAASAADVRLSAPLVVEEGCASRSPYPASVDAAYAAPPTSIPAAFSTLIGRRLPVAPTERFGMQTRLGDARGTILGGLFLRAVMGRVTRDFTTAMALPDSLERDARVKSAHFVMRMMPAMSLRAMVMSSSGGLPLPIAEGLSLLSAGHPVRAARAFLSRGHRPFTAR
ncbi:glycoside hydrolase family 3 N-terminal domain-containing protein [Microbacterium fluvii]|uniref:Glycoside hydrolase family 3 N-terminal domain-containing protein n=1 Tax=Microbacterium fluvii TaxID=415215 RepID=A0ABW2HDX0_9MICO|nr:glycoside hydrolase family 3 N-terminal domain-containing protein [Microbacterium fluvii]MCU4673044.1 glycoside hydrolase family 3 C-terminal domain-containing protein [Microbacterium fluvii]